MSHNFVTASAAQQSECMDCRVANAPRSDANNTKK